MMTEWTEVMMTMIMKTNEEHKKWRNKEEPKANGLFFPFLNRLAAKMNE
jgi:hypothetical protein